jgi:hypothetical protein
LEDNQGDLIILSGHRLCKLHVWNMSDVRQFSAFVKFGSTHPVQAILVDGIGMGAGVRRVRPRQMLAMGSKTLNVDMTNAATLYREATLKTPGRAGA